MFASCHNFHVNDKIQFKYDIFNCIVLHAIFLRRLRYFMYTDPEINNYSNCVCYFANLDYSEKYAFAMQNGMLCTLKFMFSILNDN